MYMYKVYVHSGRQGLNLMALKNYAEEKQMNYGITKQLKF